MRIKFNADESDVAPLAATLIENLEGKASDRAMHMGGS